MTETEARARDYPPCLGAHADHDLHHEGRDLNVYARSVQQDGARAVIRYTYLCHAADQRAGRGCVCVTPSHGRGASLWASAMNDYLRFCCAPRNSDWRNLVADCYRECSSEQTYAAERAYALLIGSSKKNLMNRIYCFGASLP